MITLIAFLLLLIGSANWLTIGLLQFDFVAGLFGSQSNIFSRIVYVLIGVGAIVTVINLIKHKGKLTFNLRRLKPKPDPKPVASEQSQDMGPGLYNNPQVSHNDYLNQGQPINNQPNYQANQNFQSPQSQVPQSEMQNQYQNTEFSKDHSKNLQELSARLREKQSRGQ